MASLVRPLRKTVLAALIATLTVLNVNAQGPSNERVCKECLKKTVEYLASDQLRGRGSATEDELTAAKYVADQFKKLELQPPAGRDFIEPVILSVKSFTSEPKLEFTDNGRKTVWKNGKEVLTRMTQPEVKGKLVHMKADPVLVPSIAPGAVVLLTDDIPDNDIRRVLGAFLESQAGAIVIQPTGPYRTHWDDIAKQPVRLAPKVEGEQQAMRPSIVVVKPEFFKTLAAAPDGTEVTVGGKVSGNDRQTRNVVAVLPGSDPSLKNEYVMFSAHVDHLGICATSGDTICNGADDDASGTATVLELARIFTRGPRSKRSIIFTAFGSEELGLLGSRAFAARPPIPLKDIVAEIEFEQTGLPEHKIKGQEFWMTGSQLSDLRSLLVEHGSQLADDPFRGNPFFRASDNYSLAEKDVVAHTMSGAAEFPDYHRPGDEVQKLDFGFTAQALQAVLPGLEWLVNTDVKPKYEPGKDPAGK